MQLSIIIPVYKVEKYIRDTLQSIYRQQYDENLFEVIVINDGTPDDSMRIVLNLQISMPICILSIKKIKD